MRSFLFLATALACAPASIDAAEADLARAEGEIIVTGRAEGYLVTSAATATRTDTRLLDLPQSVQIVTRDRLDDQAQRSIADVLRYVPGTTVGQGEGNRDQITLRGQNTTADFFLDGVRDDVQYYRSLYNIERVEILKGPSALIFGRGGGGGIVNRVQKTPFDTPLAIVGTASGNSFGAWDVAADVDASIAANAAVRVNANYERLDNHRDFFGGERYAVNPTLAVDLGGARLGLSYEYAHDDRVVDRGVPSIATAPGEPNRPATGLRDTFFGVPGVNRTGLTAHIAKARLDTDLAGNLKWSSTVLYGDYAKYYTNVFANGPVDAKAGTVVLSSYSEPSTRRNVIAQTNLVWDQKLGWIDNKILFGLEYADQRSANQRRNGTLSNSVLNLARIAYPSVVFGALAVDNTSTVTVFSGFAQDQISFGPHVDLIVGVRYDRFAIRGTDRIGTPRPFARTDANVSPRVGLVLKPRDDVSVYGSYSRSFLPRSGDQFRALTPTQANLEPEKFTNTEIGAKWDIGPGFNATLAVFQLDRANATTPDPNNVLTTINVGGTRTRGVELAVAGRITPAWQVSGGYTHQDAALRGNRSVRLAQVPQHQVALWNRYDISRRVGFGVGVVNQSSQFAAIRTSPTTTRLPAFTRVDAAVFVKATQRIDLQVNVENLFDTTYFSDAQNNNNISTGAPVNARFTARVKF